MRTPRFLLFMVPVLTVLWLTSLFCFPAAGGEYEEDSKAEMDQAFEAMLGAKFLEAASFYRERLKSGLNEPLADYYLRRFLQCSGLAGPRGAEGVAEIKKLIKTQSRSPLLKTMLSWGEIRTHLEKGKLKNAETLALSMGFVSDWAFLGPFENEGETGFSTVTEVEKELPARKTFQAFDKSYKGKAGPVRWSAPRIIPPDGIVRLNHCFRESNDVSGYVLTYVHAKEAVDAAFRLGSDGAVKVWLNRELLFSGDTYRSPGPDQDGIGARLTPGWNEILVKVCHKKGPWKLLFRITDPAGAPLLLPVHPTPWLSKDGEGARCADRGAGGAKVKVFTGARSFLEGRMAQGDLSPMTVARWTFLILTSGALDENDRTARDRMLALCKKNKHPMLRLLLAQTIPSRNRTLREVKAVTDQVPDKPLPWFHLAKLYGSPRPITSFFWMFSFGGDGAASTQEEYAKIKEVEIWEKEEAALRKVIDLAPGFLSPRVDLAYLFCRRAGMNPRKGRTVEISSPWALEARRRLFQLQKRMPDNRAIKKLLDGFVPLTDEKLIERYQGYVAENHGDASARGRLIQLLRKVGRLDDARTELARALALEPANHDFLTQEAAILRSQDRFSDAALCYEKGLLRCPDNVKMIEELAETRLLLGERDVAQKLLKRALEIRPQLVRVARRLRHLGPRKEEFWKPHRLDLAPVIQKARAGKSAGEEDAVCFLKNDVIYINPNGTAKLFTQRVLKLLTEKAVQEYQWISAFPAGLDYFPATRGQVITAKVIRGKGEEIEGNWWEGSSNASFDDLRKGDVIVFESKVEETGEPRYKGYFGLMLLLQDEYIPFRKSSVTFIHPKEKKVHFHAVKVPGTGHVEEKDGHLIHRFSLENIPEVKVESNMPVIFELCPFVHASTFGSWQEISDWVMGICRDQFETCPELETAVHGVIKGLSTDEEKVDALFKYMVSEIRYEHLSLADHAYRPFKACKTFQRKYGDCKDTATLLVSMLAIAGIPANFVLVRAGNGDRLDLELPSMHIFNHAIAYVPGIGPKGLFLDGTARYCGSRELPDMDQGAVALVVGKGKEAKALYLPYDGSKSNQNLLRCGLLLTADGSGELTAEGHVTGQDAFRYRAQYQKGSKRKELMEREYNRYFKSVTASKITFSDLGDYNAPVTYTTLLTVPSVARRSGSDLVLRGSLFPLELCRLWAETDSRYHDLIIGPPRTWKREVTVTLPAGHRFKTVPEGFSLKNDLASFSLVYERGSPGKLTIRTIFQLLRPRIRQKDYAAFRAFAVACDQAETEEIVVSRTD